VKDSQKEFFAARVDPEVLETLKAAAEARGVRVSAIAREAFDEWIARHIENRCAWCGSPNLPGADWCGSCTSPISPAAMEESRRESERVIKTMRDLQAASGDNERRLIELEARMREAYEVGIVFKEILDHPALREVARTLYAQKAGEGGRAPPGPDQRPLPPTIIPEPEQT